MTKLIKTSILLALPCVLLCVSGCVRSAHSISNFDYQKPPWYASDCRTTEVDPAFAYRGELTEFDVLGIARGQLTSEASIRRALDEAKNVRLRRESSILLIQSGALFPDGAMVTELGKHFRVMPFSGVPPHPHDPIASDPETFAKSLRMAAARAANDIILCYWGYLETESENLPAKTISWLPVANWVVPDEKQKTRIRIKAAIIDVRSGSWALFSPEPIESTLVSERKHREAADKAQVEKLKSQAYQATVTDLLKMYVEQVAAK